MELHAVRAHTFASRKVAIGAFVAFATRANNVIGWDTDGNRDIFLRGPLP